MNDHDPLLQLTRPAEGSAAATAFAPPDGVAITTEFADSLGVSSDDAIAGAIGDQDTRDTEVVDHPPTAEPFSVGSDVVELQHAARLERVREYAEDALQRKNHLQAAFCSVQAQLFELAAHYGRAINSNIATAAAPDKLEAFAENQTHLREYVKICNQVHLYSQFALKLEDREEADPLLEQARRRPPR